MFQYLCGLTLEQFNIILKCALPYVHLIPYPNCAGNINLRQTDSATELLCVFDNMSSWTTSGSNGIYTWQI